MNTNKLIASIAAVLFTTSSLLTTASLSAVHYNVDSQAAHVEAHSSKVIDLAPVNVSPSAAELRAAALLADVGVAGIATMPTLGHMGGTSTTEHFSLIGSQLAMPYYSFSNKFGRISKE